MKLHKGPDMRMSTIRSSKYTKKQICGDFQFKGQNTEKKLGDMQEYYTHLLTEDRC